MSILPLNKEITKVPLMGTSNAGITCHADDETLMEIVRKCSETLNLRAHIVGNKKVYFGCDVEGHKGSDGKQFLSFLFMSSLFAFSLQTFIICLTLQGFFLLNIQSAQAIYLRSKIIAQSFIEC